MKVATLCLALGALSQTSAAQQPPDLKLLAQTHAQGAGVQHCEFDTAGDHMVTAGAFGDLVYWDAKKLRVLSRHTLPHAFATSLTVHPTKPMAFVASQSHWTSGIPESSLDRFDLESGERTHLGSGGMVAIGRDGKHLAVVLPAEGSLRVEVFAGDNLDTSVFKTTIYIQGWNHVVFDSHRSAVVLSGRRAGHCRIPLDGTKITLGEMHIRSFDAEGAPIPFARSYSLMATTASSGRLTASFDKKTEVVSLRAADQEPVTWSLKHRHDSWLDRIWLAPDGTVLVADAQDQLHALRDKPNQNRLLAGHRAATTGLTWSRDGRYLAIQSMSALRIVDRAGKLVLDRAGTHAVVVADDGPEFTLMTRDGLERWNPAAQRRVGDLVSFRGGRPSMSTSGRGGAGNDSSITLYSTAVLTPAGDGWLYSDGRVPGGPSGGLHIARDGQITAAKYSRFAGAFLLEMGCAISIDGSGSVLAGYFTPPMSCGNAFIGCTVFGALRTFTKDGSAIDQLSFRAGVHWLRQIPGSRDVLVGMGDGTLTRIDPETLTVRTEISNKVTLNWLEFVTKDHAIAASDKKVWWVNTTTGKGRGLTLPAGIKVPRLSAMSPYRQCLALAAGSDVWILAVR